MSTMVINGERVRDVPPRTVQVNRPTAPPCRQSASQVRLTRRGRIALVLVVLALSYVVLTMLSAPAASTGHVHHAPAHTVVVEPGQTLWDIARSAAPREDPREVVQQIVDLNSLPDPGSIRPGQPLNVPAH
jgi:Tfp pilus assembly protein FimV